MYWNQVAHDMQIMSYKLAAGWLAIVIACFVGWTMVYVGFGSASEGLNKRMRDLGFPHFADKIFLTLTSAQLVVSHLNFKMTPLKYTA